MYSDDYFENADGAEFKFQRPLGVSEINDFIKRIFDGIPQFADIAVQGEISNFKNHYSTGHFYFTLKDETSSIRAVMFKTYASRVRFAPENGMKVTVHGRISVFPRDGQYQIYCDSMEPLGIGSLYAAFEQLKLKLAKKGMFDESHKKELPRFPSSVGVITSATGAAVRDIINVASRRWPCGEIVVYPALVQGDGAVDSLIAGLNYFNNAHRTDVIIIGRGGGSIEDLWAFNSEKLANVIFSSEIPVISAVGHETDFTISDFVSDVRAPTPSAAAEIAFPDINEVRRIFTNSLARQKGAVTSLIASYAERVARYSKSRALTDPMAFIDDKMMLLSSLSDRLNSSVERIVERKGADLSSRSALLNSLSPLAVISRGYGVVRGNDGKILKLVKDLKCDDVVNVTLSDGSFEATVNEIYGGHNG